MGCAGLQPMVREHCDCMGGRSVIPKPDDFVIEALEGAREFHAASTGIGSSFT